MRWSTLYKTEFILKTDVYELNKVTSCATKPHIRNNLVWKLEPMLSDYKAVAFLESSKKFKSNLYYTQEEYVEACYKRRDPSPRLSTWATQHEETLQWWGRTLTSYTESDVVTNGLLNKKYTATSNALKIELLQHNNWAKRIKHQLLLSWKQNIPKKTKVGNSYEIN